MRHGWSDVAALGCALAGAVIGSSIATSIAMRDPEGWSAIPVAMVLGFAVGGAVGTLAGVVLFGASL